MKKEVIQGVNQELQYKIILLGDTSVGKTCFFRKIATGIFMEKNISTVGIDKKTIEINCDLEQDGVKENHNVIINITDTAGQERFKALTRAYYKGSDASIILYDITERKTFEHVKEWIDSLTNEINNNKYTIFLMGTKVDLVESGKKPRAVTLEEAMSKCQENGLNWGGECSNKDFSQDKFREIFKGYIQIIHKKLGHKRTISQSRVQLANNDNKKNKDNCLCKF